jgi:Phage integrase family
MRSGELMVAAAARPRPTGAWRTWRRRMGIEPTSDSDCRSTVLKTAPPTRTSTPPSTILRGALTWAFGENALVRCRFRCDPGSRDARAFVGDGRHGASRERSSRRQRPADGHVARTDTGEHLRWTWFYNQHYRPAAARPGLPGVTFKHLRHTYASQLARQGESIYSVSRLLGHSSIGTTERVYAHFFPHVAESAAARLGDRYRAAMDAPAHTATVRDLRATATS